MIVGGAHELRTRALRELLGAGLCAGWTGARERPVLPALPRAQRRHRCADSRVASTFTPCASSLLYSTCIHRIKQHVTSWRRIFWAHLMSIALCSQVAAWRSRGATRTQCAYSAVAARLGRRARAPASRATWAMASTARTWTSAPADAEADRGRVRRAHSAWTRAARSTAAVRPASSSPTIRAPVWVRNSSTPIRNIFWDGCKPAIKKWMPSWHGTKMRSIVTSKLALPPNPDLKVGVRNPDYQPSQFWMISLRLKRIRE